MNEAKRDALKPEEELVDVLLDFIIVSATLAKKVTQAVREIFMAVQDELKRRAKATAKSPTGLLPKGCQLECPVLPGQRPPFSTLSETKNTVVTACFRKRLSQTPSRISKSEITENCRNIWWRTAFQQSWIKRHGSWHRLLRQGIHRTSRHRMSGIRLRGNCSAEYAVSLTAIIIIRPPISSPLPHTDV